MNLEPISAKINKCETDFVIVTRGRKYGRERQQIVIGECKTTRVIDQEDIDNLAKVRDALKHEELDVYIVFSKLAPYIDEEIRLCQSLQPEHERRVIMLTDQELKPYDMYEWTPKKAGISEYAFDLDDMAQNTHIMYFQDKAHGLSRESPSP